MTQIPFDTNIWFLLVIVALVLVLLWAVRSLRTGTVTVAGSGTVKGLGLLAAAAIASTLVSPNTIEALLHPFGPGTFVALFLLAAVGSAFLNGKARSILRWAVMGAVSAAGLLVIYQFVGLTKLIEIRAGLVTMFAVTLPFIVGEALHRKKSSHDHHLIAAVAMGIACFGGLFLTAHQILPTWNEAVLPYWANWQILLESYKNWRHLLVGVGAQNFLAAFTAGRPIALNMTPLWNTRFTLGSSLALHIATVYGLAGAAAFGWFLFGFFKVVPFRIERNDLTKLVSAFAFLFLPPSFGALIVAAALLITHESVHPVSFARHSLTKLIGTVALLLAGAAGYGLVRAYSAELAFARSLTALENRDGTGAYNLQIAAISRNPRITRFHTAYSQTNLALANAIAENSATASADRQTATQLIQQAIREAKIGVNLAPHNILAWENIASVYQSLTGVAQGADQWTVAAYSQAAQLDTTNPVIRLRLGGAYVGQQKLDLAAESYVAAIQLKPDYANAYYNLAFVYREQKKYLPAAQALKEAMRYVTRSEDVSRAGEELDELRELLTEEEKLALDEAVTIPAPLTTTSPEPLSPLP